MRKVAVISSASGNGKTTVARHLAGQLGVPFVELDAFVHGPGWAETPDDVLRTQLQPILASDGWVIDGDYERKLGTLVVDAADLIVWLDLPIRVWLPRLLRRTIRRMRSGEELWNGNRESMKAAIWGRESLFMWAFRSHVRHRRQWPRKLAGHPVLRLKTPEEVDLFMMRPIDTRATSARP
jgi:adenylate kinase family enzyme